MLISRKVFKLRIKKQNPNFWVLYKNRKKVKTILLSESSRYYSNTNSFTI